MRQLRPLLVLAVLVAVAVASCTGGPPVDPTGRWDTARWNQAEWGP